MKVMQVNVVYNVGSTGKIVYDIHTELKKQNIASLLCYGRGEKVQEENVYKVCSEFASHVDHFWGNLSGVLYGGCLFSTNRLISLIKKEKPDIVHLHCLNGFFVNIYRLVKWLKKHKIKTVLTLHAEFMYTGGCGHSIDCHQWSTHTGCGHSRCPRYRSDIGAWFFDRSGSMWKRMKKAFEGFHEGLVITSVSPWLMERAARSPILGGKHHRVILNGIDTSVFCRYGETEAEKTKKELGILGEKMVFHATANFNDDLEHIKGGYYILELAKRMPDVKFVVAGSAKEGMEIPQNVILLGRVNGAEALAKLYSAADLTVITSRKETFSMIVAESLCCGTPIVGFQAGAPEMIAIPSCSAFCEHGDLEVLEHAVREWLIKEKDREEISREAMETYSREKMVREYQRVYLDLANEVSNGN